MSDAESGLSDIQFLLPADARLMAVTDLSLRLQAKIGPAPPGGHRGPRRGPRPPRLLRP